MKNIISQNNLKSFDRFKIKLWSKERMYIILIFTSKYIGSFSRSVIYSIMKFIWLKQTLCSRHPIDIPDRIELLTIRDINEVLRKLEKLISTNTWKLSCFITTPQILCIAISSSRGQKNEFESDLFSAYQWLINTFSYLHIHIRC